MSVVGTGDVLLALGTIIACVRMVGLRRGQRTKHATPAADAARLEQHWASPAND